MSILAAWPVLVISSFVYYSPLTCYRPLRGEQVQARAWLHAWHLRPR